MVKSNTFNLKEENNFTEQSARGRGRSTLPAPEDSTVPSAESEDSVGRHTDLLHQRDKSGLRLRLVLVSGLVLALALGSGLGQSVSGAPAPGDSATPLDKNPKPGDLIEIFRGPYQHWALYIGNGEIVHVVLKSNALFSSVMSLLPLKMAIVKREKLEDVVGKDKYRINNLLDEQCEPRPTQDIVEDANRLLGEKRPYNLLTNNCEHFVTLLRYRQPYSSQVEKARKAAVTVFATGIFICAVFQLFGTRICTLLIIFLLFQSMNFLTSSEIPSWKPPRTSTLAIPSWNPPRTWSLKPLPVRPPSSGFVTFCMLDYFF